MDLSSAHRGVISGKGSHCFAIRAAQPEAGGSIHYYTTEHPGNITGLIDSGNQLVNQYRYRPFGVVELQREGTINPLRFQSREIDPTVGIYYFRNRWYDPELARFISEDPIGLAGNPNRSSVLPVIRLHSPSPPPILPP